MAPELKPCVLKGCKISNNHHHARGMTYPCSAAGVCLDSILGTSVSPRLTRAELQAEVDELKDEVERLRSMPPMQITFTKPITHVDAVDVAREIRKGLEALRTNLLTQKGFR